MTSSLGTGTAAPPAARPTDTGERLHVLDVLRGLALLGMILVHFHGHSLDLDEGVDGLVRTATWRLVEAKSHGTFALLFGAGFALQLRSAAARGAPFARTYLRRLLVLALFGFAAHALFGFNVLLGYAAWAVPLLLIRSWSTRALIALAVAAAVSMALFSLLRGLAESASGIDGALAAQQARQAIAAQVNGALEAATAQSDYSLLLAARLDHMAWFYRQPFFWLPGATLILFVAGMLAVRHRVFDDPRAHSRMLTAAIVFGVVAWAVANWLPRVFCVLGLLRDQWLTFSYVGGALLLFARWPRWLEWLGPIGQAGRMALTNYLLQIAVLDLLFSGYALHLGSVRPLVGVGLTLLLFGAEVVLSRAWLARFRFGPAEWAWRSLTHGRLQPMRR
ncbi:MAG TPA: DUF418 domain-containing protein [Planctomycetota bacterium]